MARFSFSSEGKAASIFLIFIFNILACASFEWVGSTAANMDEPNLSFIGENMHIIHFDLVEGSQENSKLYSGIQDIFRTSTSIHFTHTYCREFNKSCRFGVTHFSPIVHDLSCLVPPPSPPDREQEVYSGSRDLESILNFINLKTEKFLSVSGDHTNVGKNVDYITDNLFKVHGRSRIAEKCARIDFYDLNASHFAREYWFKQRPLVIENFPTRVTPQSLHSDRSSIMNILQSFYHAKVGVKLSPSREFEGIDSLLHWGMSSSQFVPPTVLNQMQSPDLVVVRAAHEEMKLKDVLDIISATSVHNRLHKNSTQVNAYIEYLELTGALKPLLDMLLLDPPLPAAVSELMTGGRPYLWLGDGRTVGKLHFDPFDNILVQLEGTKIFRLADPSNNTRFYEGHMREAELELELTTDASNLPTSSARQAEKLLSRAEQLRGARFRKYTLSETTSMVHSPVGGLGPPDHFRSESMSTAAVASPSPSSASALPAVDDTAAPAGTAGTAGTAGPHSSSNKEICSDASLDRASAVGFCRGDTITSGDATPPAASCAETITERWPGASTGTHIGTHGARETTEKNLVGRKVTRSHLGVNLNRYPLAAGIEDTIMECPVRAGQALFVPSFWWHEVTSVPGPVRPYDSRKNRDEPPHPTKETPPKSSASASSASSSSAAAAASSSLLMDVADGGSSGETIQLNMAINYWFTPLFNKPFPCADCPRKLNPKYRVLIERLLDQAQLHDR